jgi:hypothetical protein
MDEDVDEVHDDSEPEQPGDQVLDAHLLSPLDPFEESREQTAEHEEDETAAEVRDVEHADTPSWTRKP